MPFFLPKLSEQTNVTSPIPGIWHEATKKVLSDIANSILISQLELKTIVSSIPDIWARPLLFWSALRDENHPLHKKIYNEWKALLSLIALREVKGYPVKFALANLGDDKISNSLKKLKPKPVELQKDKHYEWDQIIIIYYDEIPIGATSPTTLVFTASQYNKKLKDKTLSLKDENGFLTTPESEDEISFIKTWVTNLYENLYEILYKEGNEESKDIVNNLLGLIKKWKDELEKENQSPQSSLIEYPTQPLENYNDDINDFLQNYPVYEIILRPLKLNINKINESKISDIAVELKNKMIIIIHPQTLCDKDVTIWGTIKLSDLGNTYENAIKETFKEEIGEIIKNQNLPQNIIWIRPEIHFFTNHLIKSPSNEDILKDSELNNPSFIYPFKENILNYFTPQEIKDKLNPQFEILNKDTITFSIEITLRNGKKVKISKTYKTNPSPSEGKILNVNPPILEIFPNYMFQGWKHYYLFQYDIKTLNFKPYKPSELITKEKIYPNENIKISELNKFPTAIIACDANSDETLGLIFIQKPSERKLEGKIFAGVDLGTSNTNIWIRESEHERSNPRKLEINLKNHLKQLTLTEHNREEILKKFLVPPKTIQFPIPTIIRTINDLEEKDFILNTFMYFKDSYETPENLNSGFKWDDQDAILLQQYIKSILLLLLLETIKTYNKNELNLNITYPKAFSQDQTNLYKQYWEIACNDFLQEPIQISQNFYTEGYSAGIFFKNLNNPQERAYINDVAICLDVGGKTTDIAIWYDGKIVLSASILLAGENIIDAFRVKRNLCELLFSEEANRYLNDVLNKPKEFASLLNIIFKREENDIKRNLLRYAKKPEFIWLRKILALQFSAIAFYTAMLVAYIAQKQPNIINKLIERTSLHWGGNGAKFLSWITFGRFEREGPAIKLLNLIFREALLSLISEKTLPKELVKNIAQFQSPQPKDEASNGAVHILWEIIEQEIRHEESSEININDPICGEYILLEKNQELKPLNPLRKETLFENGKTTFKDTTLSTLKNFIHHFNEFSREFGMLTENEKIRLTEEKETTLKFEVRSHFRDMERTADSRKVIEPIFITEVKKLMTLLFYQ